MTDRWWRCADPTCDARWRDKGGDCWACGGPPMDNTWTAAPVLTSQTVVQVPL